MAEVIQPMEKGVIIVNGNYGSLEFKDVHIKINEKPERKLPESNPVNNGEKPEIFRQKGLIASQIFSRIAYF